MIRKSSRWFILALVSLSGSLGPLSAYAGEMSYSLEPFFQEIEISGGELSQEVTVILRNNTDSDATFRVSMKDFGSLDESGGVAFLGGGSDFGEKYGLASWMHSDIEQFTVPSRDSQSVPVRISDRETLPAGGHYGAVLFELLGVGENADESQVSVRSSFASLIFINKVGGEIRGMTHTDTFVLETDIAGVPDKVSVRFRNDGNTHLVPRGRIFVEDPFGRVVREGVLNADSGRMLPESQRIFSVALKPIHRALFPGTYTIGVEYRYDGNDGALSAPLLRVFPLRLMMLWVVVMVGIPFVSIAMYRRIGRKGEYETK
ncbi:MAG: hypothetical protein HGA31_01525 [Candidatus Moranbacteria bacterium]|nr:hypothetical protein [Candidatus Moranbacteria bacterium]